MSNEIETPTTVRESAAVPFEDQQREAPADEGHRNTAGTPDINEHKKLEHQIIEMSDRELARLGQDLHDGICQQLVSIAFAADLVRRDLAAKSPAEAVRVARITGLLDNVITQARNLSHTLCPVSLVGNGLGVALRELATSISRGYRVACEVDCAESIMIRDHSVATHLYRIAQEAVQSAIKHAAASRILISLHLEGESICLTINDNGSESGERDARSHDVGLSIMKYRASMAGGSLERRRDPLAGTIVTCYCRQTLA